MQAARPAASKRVVIAIDGNARDAGNYRIPGFAVLNDPNSTSGKPPASFARGSGAGVSQAPAGRNPIA